MREAAIKVWDPLVRYGHWLLVVLFAVSYLSGEEGGALHVWSGYAIALIVVGRVIWGFVGPRRARFADFVYGPRRIARYAGNLVAGHPRRFVGHSPAGGVMVVLLLAALAATTYTGMANYAVEEGEGPLTLLYATAAPADGEVEGEAEESGEDEHGALGEAARGEGEEREGGEAFEELHELFANLTLALIGVHIVGVLYASRVHHENLIEAMVTGRKRPEPDAADDAGEGARG